jgi:ent-kaurene synthase
MASTVFPSKSSAARIASIKNTLLITVVFDFFDGRGSTEELENLLALFEKYAALSPSIPLVYSGNQNLFLTDPFICRWDAHAGICFCSKHVEILFYAVYNTSNQIAAKAEEVQNRRVVDQIAEIVRLPSISISALSIGAAQAIDLKLLPAVG